MPRDVVISIATMNSREYLQRCLESLPAACRNLDWSAVVVDNCSIDGTLDMMRCHFPRVEVLRNDKPRGFGANHNQVLRRMLDAPARPRFVLVLNDDTLLPPELVTRLVSFASTGARIGAVSPAVIDATGARHRTAFAPSSPWSSVPTALGVKRRSARIVDGDAEWLDGCCLLVAVDALSVVGGFDERFYMYSEDVDLCLRLRNAGFHLRECPDSSVTHYGSVTTSQPAHTGAMGHQRMRAFYQALAKHHGVPTAVCVTLGVRAALATRGAAKVFVGVAGGDPRHTRGGRQLLRQALRSPRRPVFPDQERYPTHPSFTEQAPTSPDIPLGSGSCRQRFAARNNRASR